MKTVKTAVMTIYVVKGKVTLAKNNKTGRFVKLAIAENELKQHNAKKSEKINEYSGFSLAFSGLAIFLFFLFAFMFKNDGYVFAEYLAIFFISVTGLCLTISILLAIFNIVFETITNKQLKGISK